MTQAARRLLRDDRLMTVIAQHNFEPAQSALPREEAQQGQHFALEKTNPVQASELDCLTASAQFFHRPEKLHSLVRGNHLQQLD
jgi:hypothetical protein